MKKSATVLIITLLLAGISQGQVKINFSLANPHIESGYWAIDVRATILAGQQWRVGSSNLRYDFVTFPSGAASVHADNPASGTLACISTGGYVPPTTTQISGPAISFNITRLIACCTLSAGTYTLGRLRFNRLDTSGCIRLTMRTTSVVQDSITQWLYPASWTITADTTCWRLDYLTGLQASKNEMPTRFALYQNFPNPFNPMTTIKYDVPAAGVVKLFIYDMLGRTVRELVNGKVAAGRYEVQWDGTNSASGTYFYKLETDNFVDIKKMILVK